MCIIFIVGHSIKRGCQCSFSTTHFVHRKAAVLIHWLQKDHKDQNSAICHGLEDKSAYASNCHISPRLSLKLRAKIERYLRAGLSAKAIVRAHFDELSTKWRADHPDSDAQVIFSRDMQLTPKDIWTVRESLRRRQPFYSTDDATGVHNWVLQNPKDVLLYQPQIEAKDQPFILAWSTPWQLKKLASLGYDGALGFDATFGTNHCGVIFSSQFYDFVILFLFLSSLFKPNTFLD